MARVGSKEKIRRFLLSQQGKVVTKNQLQDVVGPEVTEWARRLRELRKEGWIINSHHDLANLKPGDYVCEFKPDEYKVFDPGISDSLRAQVLERNGNTCQMCGIGAGELDEETGRKARLQIGHTVDDHHGGKAELSNLKAVCSRCNQGAQHLTQEPPSWTWLLSQIRRAKIGDQRKALDMLKKKFGE